MKLCFDMDSFVWVEEECGRAGCYYHCVLSGDLPQGQALLVRGAGKVRGLQKVDLGLNSDSSVCDLGP